MKLGRSCILISENLLECFQENETTQHYTTKTEKFGGEVGKSLMFWGNIKRGIQKSWLKFTVTRIVTNTSSGWKISVIWFYGITTILSYFNAKSTLYIYIKYIWFGFVGFYGISTIIGYLMPNPSLYIYIKYIMIWFSSVLWHINHCMLFNAKPSLYIYIKYIWFDLVGFYGISTIVGYLIPNPLYTYISNIYDLIWLDFMSHAPIASYLMPNPLYTYILNI